MILLTGGTGLVGTKVLEVLRALQYPVRVFTRGDEDWQSSLVPAIRKMGAEPFLGDLRDANRTEKALEGCNVIINLAGIMRNTRDDSLEEVNAEAVQTLVSLAEKHRIQRFIHMSCLGASPNLDSEYFCTKFKGEEFVRRSTAFHWTVFRPSFIFGEDSFVLTDILTPMVKMLPVVPVIGTGLNEFRPIAVEDVCACVVQSIYQKETAGQIYDLVGPTEYSMQAFVQLLLDKLGKKKPIMNIPSAASMKFVKLIEKVYAKGTVNEDFIQLLQADSNGRPDKMQATFQVSMAALEDRLSDLMGLATPAAEANPT